VIGRSFVLPQILEENPAHIRTRKVHISQKLYPADCEQAQWHVLFVRSNQEKKVANHLIHREVEYLLPCYASVRQWKDRRVELSVPLFPGYVFVRLPFLERLRVLTVPNVVSLVGTRSTPSIISENEIVWLRKGIEYGGAAPHEYLEAGQRVVIVAGAMVGMEGILMRKQNKSRVIVSVKPISCSFAVEVRTDCVRLLERQPPFSLSVPSPYKAARDRLLRSACGGSEDSLVA
jgi:transcription antitermination factor NusG